MTDRGRLANGDSEPFWEGTRAGELRFQKCRDCGAVQFPPRHHCAICWEADLDWIVSGGHGVVESFTVVRRAPLPAFRDAVPYVVAAVALEEGPRMITNIFGEDALDVSIGDAVEVAFAEDAAGEVLPQFRRV